MPAVSTALCLLAVTAAKQSPTIVGGKPADIQDYRFVASLQDVDNQHFCGAAIIDASWVVTAQHCVVDESIAELRLLAGTSRLSQPERGQLRRISRIVRYPRYREPWYGRDVALLRLDRPLHFNRRVGPVVMTSPQPLARYYAGRDAGLTRPFGRSFVMGWGAADEDDDSVSDELRVVSIRIVRHATAEAVACVLDETCSISTDQLAAAWRGNADTCWGDSGGPLVVKRNGVNVLAGLTSWGFGCGERHVPGWYVRISAFRRWIDRTIGRTKCRDDFGFVDAYGYVCSDWLGYDCTRAVETRRYTQWQEDAVIVACPATCGMCRNR